MRSTPLSADTSRFSDEIKNIIFQTVLQQTPHRDSGGLAKILGYKNHSTTQRKGNPL